jgi:hypothetical protein
MTRRLMPWVILALATSCGDSSAPLRADAYEWRLFVPTTGGRDTLAFAWPSASLPVTIWAEDTLDLPTHAANAITTWQSQFLYGEFRGQMVSDSNDADIIITAGQLPTSARMLRSMARECEGGTDVPLDPVTKILTPPFHVFIDPRLEGDIPAQPSCLNITTAHEIGHALGIFQHSPDPEDLMYSDPVVIAPSARDRNTINRAYHTPTTIQLSR